FPGRWRPAGAGAFGFVFSPRLRAALALPAGAVRHRGALDSAWGRIILRGQALSCPTVDLKHMLSAAETAHSVSGPLTVLNDEERMFQTSVRKFARERIGPYVREMDQAGVFRQELLREMFELGLMGIEIPEEFGGQSGNFFQAVLAVEALAAVDPSAAVIADVQNTIANNILLRWGNAEQKRRYFPRLARDMVASFALSEAGSGSDAFALTSR